MITPTVLCLSTVWRRELCKNHSLRGEICSVDICQSHNDRNPEYRQGDAGKPYGIQLQYSSPKISAQIRCEPTRWGYTLLQVYTLKRRGVHFQKKSRGSCRQNFAVLYLGSHLRLTSSKRYPLPPNISGLNSQLLLFGMAFCLRFGVHLILAKEPGRRKDTTGSGRAAAL